MKEKLKKVEEIAKQAGLQQVLNWVEQAKYMLSTYEGTNHETEVYQMIENTLAQMDLV